MQNGYLFGAPVLYSSQPIPRKDVPRSWYCCDLCGSDEEPYSPCILVELAEKNYAGSVLSFLPLKDGWSSSRPLEGMFQLTGESVTLSQFCQESQIRCPEAPVPQLPCSASSEEQTRQTSERSPAIGQVTFASGECRSFPDPQRYLQAIREEFPYRSLTGFRCKTLTEDPVIRQAVEAALSDLREEENARILENGRDPETIAESWMTFPENWML